MVCSSWFSLFFSFLTPFLCAANYNEETQQLKRAAANQMCVCPATFLKLLWAGGCGSGNTSVHLWSRRQSVVVSRESGRAYFSSLSPPVSLFIPQFYVCYLWFFWPVFPPPSSVSSIHSLFLFCFLLSASMTHFLGLGPINHRVVGRGCLPFLPGCPSSSKQVIESEKGSRSQQ